MVEIGLQVLLREERALIDSRRVGLITHAAAVGPQLRQNVDVMLQSGVRVTALFAPEHGFDGAGADGLPIADVTDKRTGLPVYSLYGGSKEPRNELLENVDVLVFDMQDVGARFYTFSSTLYHVLGAAARTGKELIVLDRPNPINGMQIEGPRVDASLESFISRIAVPIRHALTTGELARFIMRHHNLDVALTVIPMRGWRREMWFDETGWTWIPLSPGMPHFSTAVIYPGICLIEGTNLSEGRGTALPFEIVGAPWLDGAALADTLNRLELPGVRFRPHAFTPTSSKHREVKCNGVQAHVTERRNFRPVYTGLQVIAACLAQNPERFEFLATSWEGAPPHLDLLTGTSRIREGLYAGVAVDELVSDWERIAAEYAAEREPQLLYV